MTIRRLLPILAATLAAISPLRAEISEELGKKLFNVSGTLEDFTKVTEEAKKEGAPAQIIAEAKLVWGLRHKDTEYLSKIVPELEEAAKHFKKENSSGLGDVDDFKALISFIKALEAAARGDETGLKEHITEAFWLSPGQASLFAETITFFRTQARMAKVVVDLDLPLANSKGESTTLGAVLGKDKALLLDFWASWCGPCMELMPELREKAAYLARHGIAVAGVNMENSAAIADKVRKEKGMQEVAWLVEPESAPFKEALDIDSIPRMVLVSPQGKVLFNGHPRDPALWTALKKVDSKIEPMKAE
jgi:thiol-disulfide isomerase/thioredoxin